MGMNAKSDPTEEERKGGSGHIGKMVFSAGDARLAIVAYVPEEKQGDLDCEEWLGKVLSMQPGGKMLKPGKSYSVGEIPQEANNFLRKKGLFPEDNDDDDDDFVFGDDDFPS